MARDQPDTLAKAFRAWADQGLASGVPATAMAFSFNLYEYEESFGVGLTGSPRYDPADPDWACDEVWAHREPLFELPRALVGHEWEQGLAAASKLVREYLRQCRPGHRLRQAEAVTVGFVDGDLHLVWANGVEHAAAPPPSRRRR